VVVGYDGSENARDGLALAALMARETGAALLLGYVFAAEMPSVGGWDEWERGGRAEAERVLEEAVTGLGGAPAAGTRALVAHSPARGLHDLAEAEEADLLVLGPSHRGALGRVLLGSVGERVAHAAPCAVAVPPHGYRGQPPARLGSIAVAFDGSPESEAALADAAGLAQACGASLRLLAVLEAGAFFGYSETGSYTAPELIELERGRLEREVQATVDGLPPGLEARGELLAGSAVGELARAAADGSDLLVAGSRGYGPLRRVLLGGVSTGLMREGLCPVVVVPRPDTA
jgi:nucleotide-binding universal stress UspA family protein